MASPVRIQLDQQHACYTNLDELSGKVFLSLRSQETIAAITVKLEGESKSRLQGAYGGPNVQDPYARDQAQLEFHKLLYKIATVFPTPELGPQGRSQYTLPPGQYEYPFKFKIPFNNDCVNNNSVLGNLNYMQTNMTHGPNAHMKKTLPPTLISLPGEAEIQYYIKATVQRPAFYKENWRRETYFMFKPIEPPRPAPNGRESYARVHHQFAPANKSPDKGGLFKKDTTNTDVSSVKPPSISVEGRLPDPPIVTCNEPLPLRILVTLLNESPATLYLNTLSIELVGYSAIRANFLRRDEVSSWTILSTSNQRLQLTTINSNSNTQIMEIPASLWKQKPIPSTVSPSFQTCNIGRTYVLHIKAGISWAHEGTDLPELNVQTMRMPVEVYSGIPPPRALLDAMANRPPLPARPPTISGDSSNLRPPNPNNNPRPPSDHIEPSPEDIPPDAPPSYEDAMADSVAPIDGPRRSYHQQEREGAQTQQGTGEKSASGGLFDDS